MSVKALAIAPPPESQQTPEMYLGRDIPLRRGGDRYLHGPLDRLKPLSRRGHHL